MAQTISVYCVYGAPNEDMGHSLTFYVATKAQAKAIIKEHDLFEPITFETKVTLNREGIAEALQDVINENCINEG